MLFILNKSHEVVGSLNSNGDLSRITTYFDDKYVQDLGTGAETFEFSTMADTEQAQHLVAGNFIAFKEDGEFKLFNIIQIEEVHEEVFTKTVYCEMAGIELINEIIRPMKILNSSLRKFLTTILEGTEWQLGKLDAGFTQVFDFESTDYKSAYELIQEYAVGIYGAEISYRVEIEHGRIVGKYIDCYKQRGKVDGFRFAYGSNLTSVTRTVDMSNLATALIGVGKSGITFKEVDTGDKPYGQDFVVNEDAFKQWNINGSHIFGVHKEETESPQELLRLTRNALIERSNPQVKYEMKVELLGREVKIGDTVNVVDHEFNPPLYLSARVNQLTKSKTNPYDDEVVLANFKELRSNITEEMRALASQLEGYVDSQFPIGSSQIQNGAVGKEQFSKTYHTEIVADAVYASLVETEELIAGKANIGDLEVVNARIENLQADKADITELNAQKAEIEELIAQKADIESLKAITANIETLYTDKANVTDLNALNATVNNLKAEKADITDLNATNATINQLKVDKADINSLNALEIKVNTIDASKANISDLNATNATIGHLQASKADIAELNAVKGNIQILESEVADIEHILAGNITADNIASGTITAGSGIIANGAIGNAEISSVDAGKISAGTVDTSKVTIQGSNGHLRIKGNRLQVFNGTGSQAKERVSVGDVNGDGTIYGLRVRGADGTTILLDENGVTSEGITDGSITNEKISDNAEIDGAKLNINSVVSKINEDGTEVIKGTKIEVDGTSLTTKLSNMTIKQDEDSERISQAQTQITANENALKLKVDNQTYQTDKQGTQTTLDKHTSEINALQGEVSLKVDRTGVESIVDEVSGELIDSKIDTAKAEIKLTTDAITQNITNLSNTVSNKADSSTVSTINSKVAQLNTTLSGISGKVSNVEKTVTNLGNSVEGVEGEIETLKSDVASLEVTTSGISQKVSNVETTTTTLNNKVNVTVKDIKVYYAINTSSTTAPTSGWSTTPPTWVEGKFIWSKTTTTLTNGQSTTTNPVCITGAKGATGATGQTGAKGDKGDKGDKGATGATGATGTGIESITTEYYLSTSKTSQTGGSWVTAQPTWSTGKYLWTRSKIVYKNPTSTAYTAPVCDSSWDAINDVNVGGRNLIQNSAPNTTSGWSASANWTLSIVDCNTAPNKKAIRVTNSNNATSGGLHKPPIDGKGRLIDGETYTISAWIRASKSCKANFHNETMKSTNTIDITTSWKFYKFTSAININATYHSNVLYVTRDTIANGMWLEIHSLQLEKGSKATDWTPAPEDIQSQIDTNKTNISTTSNKVSTIETNLSGITSRVGTVETKTTTLEGKVTSHESRIKTAENKITDSAIINTVSSTIDSKVNAGISNIKLGGRNYIYYGKGDVKKGFFTSFNKVDDGYGEHTLTSQKTYSSVGIGNGFLLGCRDYEVGKQITFSYEIMYTKWDFPTGTDRTEFWIGQRYTGGTTESSDGAWRSVTSHTLPQVGKNGCELNKWFKVEKVITIPQQAHSSIGTAGSIQFYNSNADVSASVTFRLRNVKIEYGNKATDWTPSPEETENIISDTEKILNENIDNAISDAQKSILQNVSDNYATSEKLNILSQTVSSNMTQTNNNINMQFETATNYTKEVDGKLQNFQNTVGTHIRFSANGIDLGKTNSPFTATLDNTQLAFKQDGSTVAYISNNKMYITQAEIKETLRIGTSANGFFSWVQGSKGNLSLKWSDK